MNRPSFPHVRKHPQTRLHSCRPRVELLEERSHPSALLPSAAGSGLTAALATAIVNPLGPDVAAAAASARETNAQPPSAVDAAAVTTFVPAGSLSAAYALTPVVSTATQGGAGTGGARGDTPSPSGTNLEAPGNFEVDLRTSPLGVHMSWTDDQTPKGFEVYRSLGSQPVQKIRDVPFTLGETKYEFTDVNVTHGNTYSYKVRAVSPGDQSPYTPVLSVVIPA
jgi:hypothetical protein